jgi:hypothetical protein
VSRLLRLRDGTSINLLGLAALGVLVAAIVLITLAVLPLVSLWRSPPAVAQTTRDPQKAQDRFVETIGWAKSQFQGRHAWGIPPAPAREVVQDTRRPATYTGPSLVAYINGVAWFSDGQKVSAENPQGKTVRFVSANPPWSVRVLWEGAEFDVDLFKKTDMKGLAQAAKDAMAASKLGLTPNPSSTPPPPPPPTARGPEGPGGPPGSAPAGGPPPGPGASTTARPPAPGEPPPAPPDAVGRQPRTDPPAPGAAPSPGQGGAPNTPEPPTSGVPGGQGSPPQPPQPQPGTPPNDPQPRPAEPAPSPSPSPEHSEPSRP